MKIFNWVHRKFNHNILKDGFARNVKKTESIAIDTNTKALLEQVALVDVLGGWRDGILTIGTFGFDPLQADDQEKEFFICESGDEEGEEGEVLDFVNNNNNDDDDDDDQVNSISAEDEEVNPLIFTAFASNADIHGNDEKADHHVIITLDAGVQITPFVASPRFDIDTTDIDQGKKRRTTLADLFYEDSDSKKKPNPDKFEPNVGKKQSVRTKNGLSFAKKLIPHVKEDSRPIKKLHQMMRRMLKRKIHPEIEGKANKPDGQNKASILERLGNKYQACESVSLLQIPADATAV